MSRGGGPFSPARGRPADPVLRALRPVPLQKADLWSCGVLLFVMVTGAYPFRRPEDESLKPPQKLNAMLMVGLGV